MSLSKAASRVLFNEDYLDIIFPYLSTADLKSVRLVTPFWNKIGTKFLGRKSLKPLHFSDLIYNKDWLALKREIDAFMPEEDPRIKLFQRFELIWMDFDTMKNYNILDTFKPSQILIGGSSVPGFTLTQLLASSILNTLSDLTLEIEWDVLISDLVILGGIANLQEMRLKRLRLQIWKEYKKLKYRKIGCRFLSNLLASQAPTLEELHLSLESNVKNGDDTDSRIQFPIFHRLTCLTFKMIRNSFQDPLNNFAPFDFCQKFPNLLRLDLNDVILWEMSGEFNEELGQVNTFEMTRGHPLKNLKINFNKSFTRIELFNKLRISFPFVEEYSAQGLLTNGSEIPWVDTLKNLEISSLSSTFNLVHLKKIETIYYYASKASGSLDVNELMDLLLNHHQELTHLKEFHISGYKITAEQMIQIQDALPPQFRDILTID